MKKILCISACALMLFVGTSDYAQASRSTFGPRDPQSLTLDGRNATWMHEMSVYTHELGGQLQVPRERAELLCSSWARNARVRSTENMVATVLALSYDYAYGPMYSTYTAAAGIVPKTDDADKRINKNCADFYKSPTDMVTLFD